MGNLCHVDGFLIADWLVSKMALDGSIIVEICDQTMAKMWHKPVEIYGEKSEAQNMCKVEWFSLV